MELYDVMRSTFAAREFTADPLPNETLFTILDRARFAPSGGNRQGWRVIVVRERKTREALAALAVPAAKRYAAQVQAGENPWNTIDPSRVDPATIERTVVPARLTEPLLNAAVVLVICVDLKVVASTDQDLERVEIISGASIYPFAWISSCPPATKGSEAPSPRWPSLKNRRSRSSWAFPTTSPCVRSCPWDGR
jgi:nitroreductase